MRFLILALDNLGDAVMATAAARALKAHDPSAEVGLWTKAYSARALAGAPDLDFLHASDPFWDAAPGAERGSLGGFLAALHGVRRRRYDAAFVLGTEWRRALCARLCGAPERVGYAVRKSGPFLTTAVPWSEHGPHTIDDHLTLVERHLEVKLDRKACAPRLGLSDQEARLRDPARARLAGAPVVVLHPFSGNPLRRWPLPNCCALIEELSSRDPKLRFVLFIGPADEALVDRGAAALTRDNVWLPFDQSIANMKAVLSLARLFIGTDSGPGHIAAGLGVPVLSLAGPHSEVERHRPWGQGPVRLLRTASLEDLSGAEAADAAQGLL
ncbi:MAG: glycosyltransferase family 9 protein [Elusimicrobia bacterium]|nr:glycosyltransferase family 9 protein [Elusimicrobiota bacterium]